MDRSLVKRGKRGEGGRGSNRCGGIDLVRCVARQRVKLGEDGEGRGRTGRRE